MNPSSRRFLAIAVALVVGVAAGFGAHSLMSSKSTTPTTTPVTPTEPVSSTASTNSLTQVYQQDVAGVVTVAVTTTAGAGISPFGGPSQQKVQAFGSGFEIDSKGDILTADHVVAGAQSVNVILGNGSTVKATVVGTDGSTDSAVIHVDVPKAELHPLTLGNSSAVQPGQEVAAIGTPFSTSLAGTMTAGIVSAINRSITAPNGFTIAGAIQTDAAINHGNSGGPLIDVATNTVIGINDQLPAGDPNANAGVGFAAPIDSVKSSAQTLIAGGTVKHAYMGVEIGNATSGGAKIGRIIAGSPSAQAGLKAGDIITAYNGKSVPNAGVLTAFVTQSHPGETVTLTIQRKGTTRKITLTLGTQPAQAK